MKQTNALQRVRWHSMPSLAVMHGVVAEQTLAAARRAIAARGRFVVVLAGGDTPRGLYERLRRADADWSRWHVFFGDERCVRPTNEARNSRMAALAWLDHVAIPRAQVAVMRAELGPRRAALLYERALADVGDFDLVLLGLGEDGHVASLFPGHRLGAEARAPSALPVFAAPKPPPHRVSLSARRLSKSRRTFFLVAGEGKRAAVARWRAGRPLPAAAIRPGSGVDVFVEASLLKR